MYARGVQNVHVLIRKFGLAEVIELAGKIGNISLKGFQSESGFTSFRHIYNSSCRCAQSQEEGGDGNSSSSRNVLKSWVNSVINTSQSSGGEEEKEFLKRSDVKTSTNRSNNHKFSKSDRRRRLTDNMWTSDPMDEKLVWVDCEMSGLNVDSEKLLEIGVIITDGNLKEIARHESIVFHTENAILDGMGEWCLKHHGESGLTEGCRKSQVTLEAGDDQLLEFLKKHTAPRECPMAGNSIMMDREFISRQLPKFSSHFHYRNIDVSTIKELVRRWYPNIYSQVPRKKYSHRVMDDIQDSIDELKYYRSTVFLDSDVNADSSKKTSKSKVVLNKVSE